MAQTWRELRRYADRRDAEAARARLLAAGITALVPDPRVMGVHPSCRPAQADARLLVADDDFERALPLAG